MLKMKETLKLKETFQVKPSIIYEAWLNSEEHSKMTGGEAICSNEVDGTFSAWDEYITGTNQSLSVNKEIIQNWRTIEFDDADEDSQLNIQLKEVDEGCELTLIHTNIPEGQAQYQQGWIDNYFIPMKSYFSKHK